MWQVACGKSIERWQRGSSSSLPNPLSSLKRQFRVQHLPPLTIFLQAIFPSCPLHLSARLSLCLSPCLPACLPARHPVQPRANLLGTLFVAAAVDPNLQCFLSAPDPRSPSCVLPPATQLQPPRSSSSSSSVYAFELVRGSRHSLILSMPSDMPRQRGSLGILGSC